MRKSLILSILITLSFGNILSSFAQGDVKVIIRQIGTSTYSYKVINLSSNPIASLLIGYNCNLKNTDIEEAELTLEPTEVASPTGWIGKPIFVEETSYLHIYWDTLDHTYDITSSSSLDGFTVQMPQPYDLMKQAYSTVFYSAGSLVESCAKVQVDNDNDGYSVDVDCNDNDPAINPGTTEICDGVDNNCDGQIDVGLKNIYYQDIDGDSYGNPEVSTEACTPPTGYVTNNADCDDTNPTINPGVTEIPNNGIDDDCNPATPVTSVSGNGYNYPDPVGAPGFRASLSLNVNESSLQTSYLKYYYTRDRLSLTSTSITEVSVIENTATVTGVGTVEKITAGVKETISEGIFTATITNGSPDAMGIEIYKPDGTLYYSADSQTISSGNYTVIGESKIIIAY